MNNEEIIYYDHILLFISHVESRVSSCGWKRMYFYTVCQFIRELFIIQTKTDEI